MEMKEPSFDTSEPKIIPHVPWNFTMGLIHGIFFTGGRAFINPDTILPVYLDHFTNSKVIIGLAGMIMGGFGGIGNALPQLFVANRVENKIRKMGVLRAAITIRALCWGLLAIATYLFASSAPQLTIAFFFSFLIIFTLMGGIATVPFYDIWGKALPYNVRGRFFGYRQLGGGLLAISSGLIAKYILANDAIKFPDNFVLLFLLAFIYLSISFGGLGSVKEPVERVHPIRLPFTNFLKKSISLLKKDRNYQTFLLVQIFSGAGALASPFYIIYGKNTLHIELEMIGIFISVQMLGQVLSNLLWGQLSDRKGNRSVLKYSTLLGCLIPCIALISSHNANIYFIIIFFLLGVYVSGRRIGVTNFLLDIAPAKERPAYISLNGTLTLPVMIFPFMGGLIAEQISYTALFLTTFIAVFLGIVSSFKLKCVRYPNS